MYGLCPSCGAIQKWAFNKSPARYPPTGGDYEWAEGDAQTTCPVCKEKITARVRVDLDTLQVDKLVSSPMPTLEDWSCFVVAFVEKHGSNWSVVKVLHFASTQATAQHLLEENRALSLWVAAPTLLELSKNGFRYLNGNPVQATVDKQIHYF